MRAKARFSGSAFVLIVCTCLCGGSHRLQYAAQTTCHPPISQAGEITFPRADERRSPSKADNVGSFQNTCSVVSISMTGAMLIIALFKMSISLDRRLQELKTGLTQVSEMQAEIRGLKSEWQEQAMALARLSELQPRIREVEEGFHRHATGLVMHVRDDHQDDPSRLTRSVYPGGPPAQARRSGLSVCRGVRLILMVVKDPTCSFANGARSRHYQQSHTNSHVNNISLDAQPCILYDVYATIMVTIELPIVNSKSGGFWSCPVKHVSSRTDG